MSQPSFRAIFGRKVPELVIWHKRPLPAKPLIVAPIKDNTCVVYDATIAIITMLKFFVRLLVVHSCRVAVSTVF